MNMGLGFRARRNNGVSWTGPLLSKGHDTLSVMICLGSILHKIWAANGFFSEDVFVLP